MSISSLKNLVCHAAAMVFIYAFINCNPTEKLIYPEKDVTLVSFRDSILIDEIYLDQIESCLDSLPHNIFNYTDTTIISQDTSGLRKVIYRPSRNYRFKAGKFDYHICINPEGIVTLSQYLNPEDSIRKIGYRIQRSIHSYLFTEDFSAPCLECGRIQIIMETERSFLK